MPNDQGTCSLYMAVLVGLGPSFNLIRSRIGLRVACPEFFGLDLGQLLFSCSKNQMYIVSVSYHARARVKLSVKQMDHG